MDCKKGKKYPLKICGSYTEKVTRKNIFCEIMIGRGCRSLKQHRPEVFLE